MLAAVNEVGRTLLGEFGELTAGRDPAEGLGSAELLLTLDEGRAKRRSQVGPGGDRPRAAAGRLAAAGDRRGALPRRSACASSSTPERPSAAQIVVLLRAFTHVDAYEEALTAPACGRSWSAVAATGPSNRWRT